MKIIVTVLMLPLVLGVSIKKGNKSHSHLENGHQGNTKYEALPPAKNSIEQDKALQNVTWLYATAEVNPNAEIPTSTVRGIVHFRQQLIDNVPQPTEYWVQITGFNNSDLIRRHGSHIHVQGTIREGCSGSEGHYNPLDMNHGLDTDLIRHMGDLGNVFEDEFGNVNETDLNNQVTLVGEYSIYGRTWDIHQYDDDGEGSAGNAGPRMACGVVGHSNGEAWNYWN